MRVISSRKAIIRKCRKAGVGRDDAGCLSAIDRIVLTYAPGGIPGVLFRYRLGAVLKESREGAGEHLAVAFVALYSTPASRRQLTVWLREALADKNTVAPRPGNL